MRYRSRHEVEATKWFPRREYDGVIDPTGVEYTDAGWFYEGQPIQPGDYVVTEDSGETYVVPSTEFQDTYEPIEAATFKAVEG